MNRPLLKRMSRLAVSAWNRSRNYIHCFGLLRGLFFVVWERLFSRPGSLQAYSPDGQRLLVRLRSTDIATYIQVFTGREYEFKLAVEPKIIVDAGANIGFSSIYFAVQYPRASIIALEPETTNFELLCQNVSHYPNIVPLKKALWSKNEKLSVVNIGKGKWGFQVHDKISSGACQVVESIEGITIAKLIRDFKLNYIDLLKMDVEGSEKNIFAASGAWISKVGVIAIELHDWLNPGCSQSFFQATLQYKHIIRHGEKVIVFRDAYWPSELK